MKDPKDILDYITTFPQSFLVFGLLGGVLVSVAWERHEHRTVQSVLVAQLSFFFAWVGILSLVLLSPVLFLSGGVLLDGYKLNYTEFYLVITVCAFVIFCICYDHTLTLTRFKSSGGVLALIVVFYTTIILIFTDNLLTLFLAIELQALALYVLAGTDQNSTYSTEAGLKYFTLGSFGSGLLLIGISMIYGLTSVLTFTDIAACIRTGYLSQEEAVAVLVSIFFVIVGLILKVGAAPFHFWVPDVYSGVPLAITAFFASIPKIGIWVAIIKINANCLYSTTNFFTYLFIFMAVCSFIVGVYGAIIQTSLKRMLAYSAILQNGFLLVGSVTVSESLFYSNILYLGSYIMSFYTVTILLITSNKVGYTQPLDAIKGLWVFAKHSYAAGFIFVVSVLSLAGLPPFSGFFAKLYLFITALNGQLVFLVTIALFCSAAGTLYYLKIIRYVLFFGSRLSCENVVGPDRTVSYILVSLVVLQFYFFILFLDFIRITC